MRGARITGKDLQRINKRDHAYRSQTRDFARQHVLDLLRTTRREEVELKAGYHLSHADWQVFCLELDAIAERIHKTIKTKMKGECCGETTD